RGHGRGPGYEGGRGGSGTAPGAAGVRGGRRRAVRVLHPGAADRHPRPAAAGRPAQRRRGPRGAGGQPVPVHRVRKNPGGGAARRGAVAARLMTRLILNASHVLTLNPQRDEYLAGHIVVDDGQITAVGPGPAPERDGDRVIDATGCLATPGLVNTHHHLYQWATRGRAADS